MPGSRFQDLNGMEIESRSRRARKGGSYAYMSSTCITPGFGLCALTGLEPSLVHKVTSVV